MSKILVVASMHAVACSSEIVAAPPAPPVDWRSLAARPATSTPTSTSATPKERAVADAYAAALQSSNAGFASLGDLLDEDVHFTFAGFRDVHGRGNVARAHELLFGNYSQRKITISRVLRADTSQIVEWTMSGVDTTAGKPVTIQGVTLLWTRDDGSISDLHVYFDEARVNAETGRGPKALAQVPLPDVPPLGERREIDQSRNAEENANLERVRNDLDALESNSEARYVADMSDDVELWTLEDTVPLRGKPAMKAYLKSIHKAIADLDVQLDNGWGIGPFAVVEYHFVGEQRGAIGFIPAGKAGLIKAFTVDVVELQNGKMVRIHRYDNPAQILSFTEQPR